MLEAIGIRTRRDAGIFLFVGLLFLFVNGVLVGCLPSLFVLPRMTLDLFSIITLCCSVVMILVNYMWLFLGIASLFYQPLKLPEEVNSPKVSAIIPAYNEERVIKGIVSDLLKQDYPHLEVIVVAHNCSDKTMESLETFKSDTRLKVVEYRTSESGKALAMNKGFSVSTGDIIAEFDADNRIADRDMFRKAVRYFLYTDCGAIQAKLKVTNGDLNLVTKYQEIEYTLFSHLFWAGRNVLKKNCNCGGTGIFFRRTILEQVDGWDNLLTEDYAMFRKLSKAGAKILYAPDIESFDEKPASWTVLMKQRSRWQKGHIQIFFREVKERNWTGILDMLYGVAPLTTPIFYLLTSLLFIGYVFHMSYWYPPVAVWFFGTLMTVGVLYAIIKKTGAKGMARHIPLYYLFSYHWLALFPFIFTVKSWGESKTPHGFTVKQSPNP